MQEIITAAITAEVMISYIPEANTFARFCN